MNSLRANMCGTIACEERRKYSERDVSVFLSPSPSIDNFKNSTLIFYVKVDICKISWNRPPFCIPPCLCVNLSFILIINLFLYLLFILIIYLFFQNQSVIGTLCMCV